METENKPITDDDLPTFTTCLKLRYEKWKAAGGTEATFNEGFNEQVNEFLFATADQIGSLIGSSCENPDIIYEEVAARLTAAVEAALERRIVKLISPSLVN